MRFKRADTLMLTPEGADFSVFNYVSGTQFLCDPDVGSLLADLADWREGEEVRELAIARWGKEAWDVVRSLVSADAIIKEGSELAADENDFRSVWRWNAPSAVLHAAVTDREICNLDEQSAQQVRFAEEEPSPELGYAPEPDAPRHSFLDPELHAGLFDTMSRRRTVREGRSHVLEYDVLGELLFAGFGIVDWTENAACRLPLKFAPSGGARNPFDAYILVRSVEGLEPGAYRYSGIDNCVVPLGGNMDATLAELMGGQDWADTASCLIVLVANFERPMWKYRGDDNAYRVVLIEAGHIAQNVMLVATEHGLSACPSAALDHAAVSRTFDLERFKQSGIYALAITRP